jgi:ferredoxin
VSAARRADGLEIRLDRAACAGAGECVFRAPRTFRLGADGRVELADPEGDPADALRLAAHGCPNFAIEVKEPTRFW